MKHTDLLNRLKKGILLSAAALALSSPVFAQPAVFTNAIFGTNPGFVSPFTSGQSTNVGITAGGISRGAGVIGAPGDDIYNAANFTTALVPDLTDYFQFTLTPNAGNLLSLSQFAFTLQRDVLGPTGFSLRSSLDNYTSDVAGTSVAGNPIFSTNTGFVNNVSLAAPQFQNLSTPITFRLYGYAANGLGAQLAVNDFTFYGTVSSTPLSNNLLVFEARSESVAVRLGWKTTCNSDARSFTVERSVGGKDFSAIGLVNATTDDCGQEGRTYTFTAPAEANRAIYRLAMRDASGHLEYSRSVTLAGSSTVSHSITLAPSVASSNMVVRGVEEGNVCRIVDMAGRTLQSWKASSDNESVAVDYLPVGAYLLVAESADGPVAQRFWKQ